MLKPLSTVSRLGHEVTYLTSGPLLPKGNAISSNKRFRNIIDEEAKKADAGLIIDLMRSCQNLQLL